MASSPARVNGRFGGCAAHVKGEHVTLAQEPPPMQAGQRAAGGSALHEPDGKSARRRDGGNAAAAKHDVQRRFNAAVV